MKSNSLKRTAVAAALLLCPALSHADAVLDWNATMAIVLASQNPFNGSRVAAITQLAVFEAVNAIEGEYRPYLGTVTAPAGASAEAAAATAAHRVLAFYLPASADATLDAALAASLGPIPDGQAKLDGIATGEAAADAIIVNRAGDVPAPASYVPSGGAYMWMPTGPALGGCKVGGVGANAHWGGVKLFGLESASQFRALPPPDLTSGEYAKDYNELVRVGAADSVSRPQDRADVARFYAAFGPVTWANEAARQSVAARGGRSLSENARLFAVLMMAVSDAAVSVFETKYHYTSWRPETAIAAGDTDGNPNTAPQPFTPFVMAPCFPAYPSAHGTLSTAAAEVLSREFGPNGHDITFSNVALPDVTLHYTSFNTLIQDVHDARVYGGIHFRFDQEAGARQGKSVGAYIYKNLLGPMHPQ
jgi:hypothetical protein